LHHHKIHLIILPNIKQIPQLSKTSWISVQKLSVFSSYKNT